MNNPSDTRSFEAVVPADEHGSSCLPVVAQAAVPAEKAEALRSVLKLIEDGDLVRDITNDHDAMLFLKQGMRITSALSKAQAALASAFGGNRVLSEPSSDK